MKMKIAYILPAILMASFLAIGTGTLVTLANNNGPIVAVGAPASEFCEGLANQLGGIPIPNGDVCDVAVVRKSPQIMNEHGMRLNRFTLMNSVLEFTKTGVSSDQMFVMGDFALLESEMNPVLALIKQYGWTVTGIHNHMIMEDPKLTFIHWETQDTPDQLVSQINQAFEMTSIK